MRSKLKKKNVNHRFTSSPTNLKKQLVFAAGESSSSPASVRSEFAPPVDININYACSNSGALENSHFFCRVVGSSVCRSTSWIYIGPHLTELGRFRQSISFASSDPQQFHIHWPCIYSNKRTHRWTAPTILYPCSCRSRKSHNPKTPPTKTPQEPAK